MFGEFISIVALPENSRRILRAWPYFAICTSFRGLILIARQKDILDSTNEHLQFSQTYRHPHQESKEVMCMIRNPLPTRGDDKSLSLLINS